MTNAERQGKDILAQECETGDWAVDKNTGEIIKCDSNCRICKFFEFDDCAVAKAKWLNAEFKLKREFSEEDKAVLRALDKVQWLARDKDGTAYGFSTKPYKSGVFWRTQRYAVNLSVFTSAKFLSISWEDDEPTSRAEILGEEE